MLQFDFSHSGSKDANFELNVLFTDFQKAFNDIRASVDFRYQ
jgi:hypothetical protein